MNNNFVDLVELEKQLTIELENNQIFKQLQAVKFLLQSRRLVSLPHQQQSQSSLFSQSYTQGLVGGSQLVSTLEERNAIVSAVVEHFEQTENAPLKVGELYEVLYLRSVKIPGKKPITTLAAVLNGRKNLLKKDEIGRWKLIKS